MSIEFGRANRVQFRALNSVFADTFEDRDHYQSAVPSDAYLNKLLSREVFIPLVEVTDGNVVCGLAAYVLPRFEPERRELYIYDLPVLEEYRRQGVATGLINKLREIARQRGSYVIFV